jgi:hypothetical protein
VEEWSAGWLSWLEAFFEAFLFCSCFQLRVLAWKVLEASKGGSWQQLSEKAWGG